VVLNIFLYNKTIYTSFGFIHFHLHKASINGLKESKKSEKKLKSRNDLKRKNLIVDFASNRC